MVLNGFELHLGPLGNIWDHLRPFRNILDHFRKIEKKIEKIVVQYSEATGERIPLKFKEILKGTKQHHANPKTGQTNQEILEYECKMH